MNHTILQKRYRDEETNNNNTINRKESVDQQQLVQHDSEEKLEQGYIV